MSPKIYQEGPLGPRLNPGLTAYNPRLRLPSEWVACVQPVGARHAGRLQMITDYLSSNSLAVRFSMAVRLAKPEPQVDFGPHHFWRGRGMARLPSRRKVPAQKHPIKWGVTGTSERISLMKGQSIPNILLLDLTCISLLHRLVSRFHEDDFACRRPFF